MQKYLLKIKDITLKQNEMKIRSQKKISSGELATI